ncbi:hypothetical protein L3073_14170 [Ancylomarina sp. DW003]|nr:hypothetical protein [Ancylomarina sp. DW003]MDE5423362.1 hypothetical protein [Ancylomarina sp. DW003]
MKIKYVLIVFCVMFALSSKSQQAEEKYTQVSIDKLVNNGNQFENKRVEIIGLVDHLCGVDGHKMKLKAASGAVLKVVPNNLTDCFDAKLKKQLVCVKGVVDVIRIEKAYIDEMEEEGTLLCHIDHSPCKDKAWVNNKIESGKDVEIVKQDIAKLRKQMKESGKEYVNYICIRADSVNILE